MTTVGFTRPVDRLEAGRRTCESLGLDCLCAPSLQSVHGSKDTFDRIRKVLSGSEAFFTVFASATAVDECLKEFGKDDLLTYLEDTKVACTGSKTAEYLEEKVGRGCDLVPKVYSGKGIAEEIKEEVDGRTVILLRSDSGGDDIVSILEGAGAHVVDAETYGMVPVPVGPMHIELMDGVVSGAVDAMIFASPMTAKVFYEQMQERHGKELTDSCLGRIYKVAIGEPTRNAMEEIGITADAVPEKSTFEGMLKTVKAHFDKSA